MTSTMTGPQLDAFGFTAAEREAMRRERAPAVPAATAYGSYADNFCTCRTRPPSELPCEIHGDVPVFLADDERYDEPEEIVNPETGFVEE